MGEKLEILRRKLAIRASRRGMREMDILLGTYAARFLGEMDGEALRLFESLLEENDRDLLDWVMGKSRPPARFAPFLRALSESRKNGE